MSASNAPVLLVDAERPPTLLPLARGDADRRGLEVDIAPLERG